MIGEARFDIIVIGSGPGGQKAAIQGAKAGKKVAIVDREPNIGGACVYRGTIPSKTLRESALTMVSLKRSAGVVDYAIREELEVSSLMARLDKVLGAHNAFITKHLQDNGIELFHGRAKIVGLHEVYLLSVNGSVTSLQGDVIVIASGSRPRTPPDIPVDHENVLDSDSILSMIYFPRTLTVLGGGVIASEYASIFSLLGVEVTMVDSAPRPLMFLDEEITCKFVASFRRFGGRYLGEEQVRSVRWDGVSQVKTELESGEVIDSDKMLVALGRSANVEGLGLDDLNIEQDGRGQIVVDEEYRTNVRNIYAVGDVIGPPALASCSMEQGRRAICHALNIEVGHAFEVVPMGVYAVPELASVGLSEKQAREKYGEIIVGRADFEEIARGQIAGIQDGLLKIVGDAEGRRLLGVQIVGDGATNLIHLGEMALLNGNEVGIFLDNVMNFPTLAEAYRVAALNLINKVPEHARQSSLPSEPVLTG